LLWATKPLGRRTRKQWLELAALLAVVLSLGALLFLSGHFQRETSALAYVTLLPLLWAAYRFGQRAAVTSAVLLSAFSVWGTLEGAGPFAIPDTNTSLLLLQSFMGTATLTALVLAAVVSQQKRAEAALRSHEAELEAVINQTPFMLTRCSRDLRYRFVSHGYARMIGRQPEEVAGKPIVEIIGEDGFKTILPHIEKVLAGQRAQYESRVHFQGVGTRVLNVIYTPEMDDQKNVQGWIASILDVTERKRSEQLVHVRDAAGRILASANSFDQVAAEIIQAICESADWEAGALWKIDPKANQLFCSQFWHDPAIPMPNFEAATRQRSFVPGVGLPGRVWMSGQPAWLSDVTKDENFPRASAARRDGLHAGICFPIICSGQARGVLECFSRQIREPDTAFLQLLTAIGNQVGQYIDRQAAQQALRESEARKSAILESSLDAIIAMDQAGYIVDFNPAAERLFGYTRDQVLGQSVAETIIPERFRDAHRKGLRHFLQTGTGPVLGRRIEMPALRADGSEFASELAITATRLENGQHFFTAYLRDITERKKAEAELANAQRALEEHAAKLEQTVAERTTKLRDAVVELESFSYSISHDMRAPLRAMQTYGQLLLTEERGKLNEDGQRYLDRIIHSSSRLDRLIQDVLAYSRISRTEVPLEPTDLDRLVEDIINDYPAVHGVAIELIKPLDSVIAAQALLTQAISNLLTNAVKFVPRGKTPKIKIWSEEVSLESNPSSPQAFASPTPSEVTPPSQEWPPYIRLHIQDNGIGIAAQDQQRIFGIFARVYSDKEYEGTGIGLSIVKRAVDRMGGSVGLKSELGQGSTFWIQLPKA
jgi:PAS domain S-box-containing protein